MEPLSKKYILAKVDNLSNCGNDFPIYPEMHMHIIMDKFNRFMIHIFRLNKHVLEMIYSLSDNIFEMRIMQASMSNDLIFENKLEVYKMMGIQYKYIDENYDDNHMINKLMKIIKYMKNLKKLQIIIGNSSILCDNYKHIFNMISNMLHLDILKFQCRFHEIEIIEKLRYSNNSINTIDVSVIEPDLVSQILHKLINISNCKHILKNIYVFGLIKIGDTECGKLYETTKKISKLTFASEIFKQKFNVDKLEDCKFEFS